jgi:hypothetical protein
MGCGSQPDSYKNELTKVPDDKDPEGYIAGNYWRKVGGTLYDFYNYEYAGVDAATGKSMWYKDQAILDDQGVATEKSKRLLPIMQKQNVTKPVNQLYLISTEVSSVTLLLMVSISAFRQPSNRVVG